jgi:hypothetical protein
MSLQIPRKYPIIDMEKDRLIPTDMDSIEEDRW